MRESFFWFPSFRPSILRGSKIVTFLWTAISEHHLSERVGSTLITRTGIKRRLNRVVYIYAIEMRAFRHKKQHTQPSHKRSTHNCGLYVLVYTVAQYIKHTPRSTAPNSCARAWPYTVQFTKPPSQKGAVHKIARP